MEARSREPTMWDAILIDDNVWVRSSWEEFGSLHHCHVVTFPGPDRFRADAHGTTAKSTPIFVDADLGEGIRGEDFARWLHGEGYESLFLSTAFQASDFSDLGFLRGIIAKEPPLWLASSKRENARLTAKEKKTLVKNMTSAQRQVFRNRMAEYQDAFFGSSMDAWPLADGSGTYWPERVLAAWERAIYESVDDATLMRRLDQAWRG